MRPTEWRICFEPLKAVSGESCGRPTDPSDRHDPGLPSPPGFRREDARYCPSLGIIVTLGATLKVTVIASPGLRSINPFVNPHAWDACPFRDTPIDDTVPPSTDTLTALG